MIQAEMGLITKPLRPYVLIPSSEIYFIHIYYVTYHQCTIFFVYLHLGAIYDLGNK